MFILLLLAVALSANATGARPHILLMVLDDIGRHDTGVYGDVEIPMPNFVQLSKEGAVLDNFYTQPVCSPTRTSVLTGRYPFRMGLQHPWPQGPMQTAAIPLDTPTIAELLKQVGYETHAVGKWHAGYAAWALTPTGRGFSSYLGYMQGQGDYFSHNFVISVGNKLVDGWLEGYDFWDDDKPLHSAVGKYSLDLYDERITKILNTYVAKHNTKQKQADHPLFIYLAHQTVHIPLEAKRDEFERCGQIQHLGRRKYCDMLVELDDSVGSMIAQYKKHALWENTLVLVLTDNGGMTNWDPTMDGFPGGICSQGSNFPLRGSKTTLFEGGVRSLGFISGGYFPKQFAGQRYKGLAHIVDLTATALAAAGLFPLHRESLRLDGIDLMPLLTNSTGGAAQGRSEIPINIVNGGKEYCAVRFGKYKVIVKDTLVPLAHGWFDEIGNLKEQSPDVADVTFLFDLEQDEQERHNLASQHPDLVRYGLELIQSYVKSGNYMEPQGLKLLYAEGLPALHGGTWRPFMSERAWRKQFRKQEIDAGLREQEDTEEENEVMIPNTMQYITNTD